MNDDNVIVMLTGFGGDLEDQSWFCHSPGEATKMARWLNSNHIEAEAISIVEWDKLKAETTSAEPTP